jgi:hypothetical protein
VNNAKRINKLRELVPAQEAHVARMIEHGSGIGAVRAAQRIAMVFRAELANLEAGGSWTTADFNAALVAARAAFPLGFGRTAVAS